MTYANFNYQKSLFLDKRETYEYHYQIEMNGNMMIESGNRLFVYQDQAGFDLDEWNVIKVNYVLETENQQVFDKSEIELIQFGEKLRFFK